MANLKDFSEDMQKLAKALETRLPEVATGLSLTAKALSERTIREKGMGETYSTNEVPAFFFEGKALNAAGEAFIDSKVKAEKKEDRYTNWGELRQAQGLQVAHVDLGYSNKMWAGMTPLEVVRSGFIFRAPLGGNNTEVQNKMDWNRDRYGNFVERVLTPSDYELMQEYVTTEISEIIVEIKQNLI